MLRLYPGLLFFRHQHAVTFGLGLHLSRARWTGEDWEDWEDWEDDEQIHIGMGIGLPTVDFPLSLQGRVRYLTPLCILYLRFILATLDQTYCERLRRYGCVVSCVGVLMRRPSAGTEPG